jgi:hypothetical protein
VFEDDDPDAEIIARLGRSFPYATVGVWVLLADIPIQSKALYAVMRAHVNRARGDEEAWPSQASLAKMLGFKKKSDIGKYTRPLEAIQAVQVRLVHYGPRRMYKRLIYIVHEAAPHDYASPSSLREWYTTEKAAKAQVAPKVPQEGPSGTPAKPQVAPKVPQKGSSKVPTKGASKVPAKGASKVPAKGHQLPEHPTTRTDQQPEPRRAAAPLPVLPRFAQSGPGRLASEKAMDSPAVSGPVATQASRGTTYARARARAAAERQDRERAKTAPRIDADGPNTAAEGQQTLITRRGGLGRVDRAGGTR